MARPFNNPKLNIALHELENKFIFESLKKKGLVRVFDLGVFTIKKMKGRKFYHNFSGEEIETPVHNKLHFKPFPETKKKIKNFNKYYV